MTLSFTTISDTISKLTVAGLTIKDIDEIPTSGDRVPIVIPLPDFITGFGMERDSFGGASAKMTVNYTLNYRLLFIKAGAGRSNMIEALNGLTEMIGLFLDEILAVGVVAGVEDLTPNSNAVTNMGLVNAPDDEANYGCDFQMESMEFEN